MAGSRSESVAMKTNELSINFERSFNFGIACPCVIISGNNRLSAPESESQNPRSAQKPAHMRDPEIVPIPSSPGILTSRILFPLIVTAAALVLLTLLKDTAGRTQLVAAYVLFLLFYAAYIYSGIKKTPALYILPALFLYAEMTTPIATPFFYVFRTLLPGSPSQDPTFLNAITPAFFGSGLMEELMKAVPALLGLYVARRSTASEAPANRYLDWLRCSTPLEGILIGLAAGAGFVYVEALYQIVPETGHYAANPDNYYTGLVPLLERVRQGVLGNMTRAGISGFFIGLSARYPRSMIALLAVAWLLPALLHTLWNLSPYLDLGAAGSWIKNGVSFLVFAACLVGAKRMDARAMPLQAESSRSPATLAKP
jgi:RsiW-degrading membrane proteinase PrsW (M82 family)